MISRLDRLQGRDIYENTALAKINELVDAVNEIKQYLDWDEISGAENCECAKNAQQEVNKNTQKVYECEPEVKGNHKIRSTNERLREALSLAENALIRLANDACDMDEHIYIDAILSRIKTALTKGGDNE